MLRTAATLLAIMHPAPMPTSPIEAPLHFQKIAEKPIIRQVALPAPKTLELMPYKFAPMGTYPNAYPDPTQCTWGAASMKGNIPAWGNAAEWPAHARAAGIVVSETPIVGTVAISQAGYYGHAAVVVTVGNGTVTVVEKNFDWQGGVRTHDYPTSHFVYLYM